MVVHSYGEAAVRRRKPRVRQRILLLGIRTDPVKGELRVLYYHACQALKRGSMRDYVRFYYAYVGVQGPDGQFPLGGWGTSVCEGSQDDLEETIRMRTQNPVPVPPYPAGSVWIVIRPDAGYLTLDHEKLINLLRYTDAPFFFWDSDEPPVNHDILSEFMTEKSPRRAEPRKFRLVKVRRRH